MERVLLTASFARPAFGPKCPLDGHRLGLPLTEGVPWQSWGGPTERHPARGFPKSLEVQPPPGDDPVVAILAVGATALFAEGLESGLTAGVWEIGLDGGETVVFELKTGQVVTEARDLTPRHKSFGKGLSVRSVGMMDLSGAQVKLDLVEMRLATPGRVRKMAWRTADLGASFLWCDVMVAAERALVCPFRGQGQGRVSLAEIMSLVRMQDRSGLEQAMVQLEDGISKASDLDEAKGQALLFLGVVCASLMEIGAPRSFHLLQLKAARELESKTDRADVARTALEFAEEALKAVTPAENKPTEPIELALSFLQGHFADDLEDERVAGIVGLSTSHFRHLFKQRTGQPFQKYLMSLRLEKARERLMTGNESVTAVAKSVGFASLSHFSRRFTERFGVSPADLQRFRQNS